MGQEAFRGIRPEEFVEKIEGVGVRDEEEERLFFVGVLLGNLGEFEEFGGGVFHGEEGDIHCLLEGRGTAPQEIMNLKVSSRERSSFWRVSF